jgi:hypothetical protein
MEFGNPCHCDPVHIVLDTLNFICASDGELKMKDAKLKHTFSVKV